MAGSLPYFAGVAAENSYSKAMKGHFDASRHAAFRLINGGLATLSPLALML